MESKEKNFVSVVIYVHNAEKWIANFLSTVIPVVEEYFEHAEVICVDDHSDDGSVEQIKAFRTSEGNLSISVLHMSYFHGVEAAMNAGVELSIGDFVFEFDSPIPDFDGQEIMRVYRRALQGYDIVTAVPKQRQRLTSQLFYKVFCHFTEIAANMHTERFRILSRRVINRIDSMNKAVPYRKAVYANCGLKMDTIVYQPIEKGLAGKKMTDREERKYRKGLALKALILYTDVGYKFGVGMTVFMMLVSIAVAVYSLAIYALARPVAGWTTTILFFSVAFFGLFAILTIVIKYLQMLVELVFRRKRYSFESIEKLTK